MSVSCAAEQVDPLKKRELFAISLRKQKKTELIQSKRLRLMESSASALLQRSHQKSVIF